MPHRPGPVRADVTSARTGGARDPGWHGTPENVSDAWDPRYYGHGAHSERAAPESHCGRYDDSRVTLRSLAEAFSHRDGPFRPAGTRITGRTSLSVFIKKS